MKGYFAIAVEDAQRLVPVIGAGLSVPLGQPSWNDLADEVAENVNSSARRSDSVSAVHVLSQAKKQSGARFTLAVQSAIHSHIDRIITTNLDYAIETAFEVAGKPLPSQNIGRGSGKEELAIFDANPRGAARLPPDAHVPRGRRNAGGTRLRRW
jgi:hypothetical protein